MPRSPTPTRRRATQGHTPRREHTPRPGFLSIPTKNLPNTPFRAITLRAGNGNIIGFANPNLMTYAQHAALATQRLQRTGYNILSVLFAVIICAVIDLVLGSPFLRFIGVVKGSDPVSPFVSSIASASPFASSVGSVSPIGDAGLIIKGLL